MDVLLLYGSTLLTFGKAFVLCRGLTVLTFWRGARPLGVPRRYMSTLLTFGKAFVLCRGLKVLMLRRDRPTGQVMSQMIPLFFFDNISSSPFLQVGPACRNAKWVLSGPGAVIAGQQCRNETASSDSLVVCFFFSRQVSVQTCVTLRNLNICMRSFFPVSHVRY